MRRIFGYALLAVSVAWMPASHAGAAPRAQIIPETDRRASRLGEAVVQPGGRRSISAGARHHLVLDRGTLFVQTDQAILQAIDAETGQTLWSVEVGRRGHPSLRPATNADMVAVVNGSNLFVLNRHQGKVLWQQAIPGAPGAGPALSDMRVYVPSTDGLILAYRLKPVTDPAEELGLIEGKASATADKGTGANKETNKERGSEAVAKELEMRRRHGLRLQQERIPPLACQSFGRALVQPLITRQNEGEEYVAWPTDRGYLFVGRINRQEENRFEMRYKLETNAEIAARPTLLPPLSADPADSARHPSPSQDGFLHAIRADRRGGVVAVLHRRSDRGIRRADRKEGLYHDRVGRHVLPRFPDRTATLVGRGHPPLRRGQQAARLCRGPPRKSRRSPCRDRRAARLDSHAGTHDQNGKPPDGSDLPSVRVGPAPLSPRNRT